MFVVRIAATPTRPCRVTRRLDDRHWSRRRNRWRRWGARRRWRWRRGWGRRRSGRRRRRRVRSSRPAVAGPRRGRSRGGLGHGHSGGRRGELRRGGRRVSDRGLPLPRRPRPTRVARYLLLNARAREWDASGRPHREPRGLVRPPRIDEPSHEGSAGSERGAPEVAGRDAAAKQQYELHRERVSTHARSIATAPDRLSYETSAVASMT